MLAATALFTPLAYLQYALTPSPLPFLWNLSSFKTLRRSSMKLPWPLWPSLIVPCPVLLEYGGFFNFNFFILMQHRQLCIAFIHVAIPPDHRDHVFPAFCFPGLWEDRTSWPSCGWMGPCHRCSQGVTHCLLLPRSAMEGAVQDPRALFFLYRGNQQQLSGSPSVHQFGLLSKKMCSSVSSQPAVDMQHEWKINLCSYKPPRVFSPPPNPPAASQRSLSWYSWLLGDSILQCFVLLMLNRVPCS